jgi:drug/metabolite transporter (DMT)-like permease
VTADQVEAQGGSDLRTPLAFGGVVLLGGLNLVAVKFSNQDFDVFFGAGLRFALAAAVFLAIALVMKIPFPRGRALVGAGLYGMYGFVIAFGLGYWALQELPASIAGVIIAAVPIFTLLLAALQRLEPLTWRGLAGGAIAIVGIIVLIGSPQSSDIPILSALAMLGGALALAQAGIVVKKYPPCHPVATNTIGVGVGALVLLPLSLLVGNEWSLSAGTNSWLAVLYLVLLGSVALFGIYIYVLNRWPASRASYQFVLMPLVAVVLAAVLLDEPIGVSLLIGGAIVLAGVYVGALATKQTPVPADPDQEALAFRCSTT